MDRRLSSVLGEASDYRDFLKIYMRERHATRKITYEELALAAGLNSKGYFCDLLKGRKRVTSALLPKLSQAMGLTGSTRKLFELLIFNEEPSLLPLRLASKGFEIGPEIEKLRQRLKGQEVTDKALSRIGQEFEARAVYLVYSALGSRSQGASLIEIAKKTRLSKENVATSISMLKSANLLVEREDRYFAEAGDVDFSRLGDSLSFQKVFLEAMDSARKSALRMNEHPEKLFLYCAVPIDRNSRLRLRERLKAAILEVLDETQQDDGEEVQNLCVSLF